MKANVKMLAVFVIALVTMLVMAGMASAGPAYMKGKFINAQYAITGSGGCLVAPGGFNEKLQVQGTTPSILGPNVWAGVYTFERDGTGTIEAVNRSINSGAASAAEISWTFDYTVDDSGNITFKNMRDFQGVYIEGPSKGTTSYLKWDEEYYGVISPDGKSINVSYGAPMIHYVLNGYNGDKIETALRIICQVAVTGFRQ